MKILKLCWYQTRHYNLWPVVIVLPDADSVIIQLKFWNRHAGVEIGFKEHLTPVNGLFKA